MNNKLTKSNPPASSRKQLALALLCALLGTTAASADVVYVTSTPSNCVNVDICGNLNYDFNALGAYVYNENGFGAFTTAAATAPDKPQTPGARYFSNSFSNTVADSSGFNAVLVSPTLGFEGGTYLVYHIFTAANGNVSSNIVVGVTNFDGCTLSFAATDKFQSKYGTQTRQLLGYLTNNTGVATPTMALYFVDGNVDSAAQQRLIIDTFKFVRVEPCTGVNAVGVTGPLAANLTEVVVTAVTNATAVTVYQDSGSGMVKIGEKTSQVVNGNNTITVAGLVKGARVAATQTVGGQEGCVPTSGVIVGGGANPRVRVALSLRETSSTGPVGAAGSTASGNIHFLGATNRIGAAPGSGPVMWPSNEWQTITLQRGADYANPVDPSIKWNTVANHPDPIGTLNCLTGTWAVVDAIALAIDDLEDTGPYNLYIDNLQNGSTVFQTFENAVAGQVDFGFRAPRFSGTSSSHLMELPNIARVTNLAADTGTKSIQVQFQWIGTNDNRWVRLTTSGVGNPQVNLNDPISIRFLLLPVGAPMPPAPTPPSITASLVDGKTVLNWTGAHNLQTAPVVTGTYTNIPGVTFGPYTNNFVDPARFFRLVN